MKNKKKNIKNKKLPQIKKEIKDFLLSEEGKISKKNITKMGISLVALAAMFNPATPASAQHTNVFSSANHTSSGPAGPTPPHSAHGSHGSHGQW